MNRKHRLNLHMGCGEPLGKGKGDSKPVFAARPVPGQILTMYGTASRRKGGEAR